MTKREAIEYLKGIGYQASAFSVFEPYYEDGSAYKEAVDTLDTDGWIPVSLGLYPDVEEYYDKHQEYPEFIVKIADGVVATTLCYDGQNFVDDFGDIYPVTHWMPMPDVPKTR